jgi:arylsulfatase A-like enzyme
LREADIYDNSVILILADHGVNLVGLFDDDTPGSPLRWEHLAGAAHPLFLLKPRGARGALHDGAGAVHVADVGATLCAASGACSVAAGIPAGQAPPDRPRRFYEYVWKHEYWRQHDVPDLIPHDIRGPVWDPNAWLSPE